MIARPLAPSRMPRRPLTIVVLLAIICGLAGATPRAAMAQSATPAASPAATPVDTAVERHDFTVDLGDFETAAQLTYPAGQEGPFPTVILIPGSGAADMDFTLANPVTGEVFSANFLDIANYLSANGYAVARYNKHYVEDASDPESIQAYYQNFSLPMLLEDANLVYEAVSGLPQVDPEQMILFGWSEGSTVATSLALNRPDVAGLVLQSPVVTTWEDVFRYQNRELVVNFLQEVADADDDGQISYDEMNAAAAERPGTVLGYAFWHVSDPASTPEEPKLSAGMDQNGDGLLDIEAEIIPYLDDFYANFDERSAAGESPYGPQYASEQALPPVIDTIVDLAIPILVLQGEEDANVPPEGAVELDDALAAAGHPDHTLIMYPGLGHSLGPAATVFDDTFAPIAEAPLADIVTWLDERFGG